MGIPIDPDAPPAGVPLLRNFCSAGMPELNVIHGEHETEYEFPAGPVGRMGELTVIHGALIPAIGPQYASAEETICEIGCNLQTPVELLHADLLVHKSLSWAMNPRANVFSLLEGRSVHGKPRRASTLMEGDCEVQELGRGIATMSTPHIPRYNELLTCVFDSLGWDESAFRGFRLAINYPSIPALAMMSMNLAQRK